jgi:hypothetical protein
MAVVFTGFTAVQWNDPDNSRWMVLYAASAVVCLLASFQRRTRVAFLPALAVLLASVVWAATLVPAIAGKVGLSDLYLRMSEKGGAVEVGREAGGLVIVTAWMLVTVIVCGRRR